MVWSLIPLDSASGMKTYYLFADGAYKVGRKDCDIIVQTDTSISRLHAEIVIDKLNTREISNLHLPACIRVIDRSKYGTFINKDSECNSKILRKDEDALLKDGEVITFGTGSATFRVSLFPLVAFFHAPGMGRIDQLLRATMTSIGAHITRKWSEECTHILVDDSSPLTPEIFEAIFAKKQIISRGWFQVLAEQRVGTEMPSYAGYVPNLTLVGTKINTVEMKFIEGCLLGHTFVMGSSEKYKFGDELKELLELSEAKFQTIDEYQNSQSQNSEPIDGDRLILVVPANSQMEFNNYGDLLSLPRITDVKLIAAILSGRLDASLIEAPASRFSNATVVATSSHSTDETIVPESDVEADCVTSEHVAVSQKPQHDEKKAEQECEKSEPITKAAEEIFKGRTYNSSQRVDNSDGPQVEIVKDGNIRIASKVENSTESVEIGKGGTFDVIFQGLIVKESDTPAAKDGSVLDAPVNFKCFRKKSTVSGNSYSYLVPFAKEPYKEMDCEYDKSSSKFAREEKKRKEMEAMAEDLFNNNKVKKRAPAASSLRSLFGTR